MFFLTLALSITLAPWAFADKPADEPERVNAVGGGPAARPDSKAAKGAKPVQMAARPSLAAITGFQTERTGESLRVVISASGPVKASLKRLGNPGRLLVDITPAKMSSSVKGVSVNEVGVSRIRVGQYSSDTARVVLDLSANIKPRLSVSSGTVDLWIDPVQTPKKASVAKTAPKDPPAKPVVLPDKGDDGPPPPPSISMSSPLEVTGVTSEQTQNGTRVRIAVSRLVRANVLNLREPDRLVVDIPGGVLTQGETTYPVTSPLIDSIRTGQTTSPANAARVVLDLTGRVSCNLSYGMNEILVDLQAIVKRAPKKLAGTRIVIDPGHGGYDPGARGFGLQEKNITLSIARKVVALLKEMGAVATITRGDDTFVPLDGRVAIAERFGADIFVSIHCNSNGTPNSRQGTELYYYTSQSRDLASALLKRLVSAGRRNGGIFQRRFLVVRKTSMPSALVEVGYINHSVDSSKLASASFQQLVAKSVVQGIAAYLGDNAVVVPDQPAPEEKIESAPDGGSPENAVTPEPEKESNPDENE